MKENILKLSILDQSPIREGGTATDAIFETIELAKNTESFGYHRYWLAEHHDSTGLACAAPEILISQIAANTQHIRVGSGGIMLTHYSALKIAEVFRMLETLNPGRIDLGLGRAPGSSQHVANALASGLETIPLDDYPNQIKDLLGYMNGTLTETHPFHGIRAQPIGETSPQVWILGSSLESAKIAAECGLAFCYAHFINPVLGKQAIQVYRDNFNSSKYYKEPIATAGISTLCAPSTEEAMQLSWSRYCMRFRKLGVPSVETALNYDYHPAELEYISYSQKRAAIGDPKTVQKRLGKIADDLNIDELLLLTITYDFKKRIQSYDLISQQFNLDRI
ncbi:MAG: LLM class flavin-dependent oxidoreductase [Chloroflexi bacterium]|nr:LLM class flavin-dependent oxidoreductase [Chloroflexota bacterium]|tara:strand:- start:33863 stop:34870 length:1008 start_codon:yes stop_codon:yes gene_type:complete